MAGPMNVRVSVAALNTDVMPPADTVVKSVSCDESRTPFSCTMADCSS